MVSSSSTSLLGRAADFLLCYKLPNKPIDNESGEELTMERDSLVNPKFWRAVVAEGIALAIFIPLAIGSSVPWTGRNEPSNTQIALANGLMIATLIQCFSHVSGAHFNPAVTIPLAWNREISIVRAAFYIVSQCAGSSLGAKFLQVVTPLDVRSATIGCTLLGEGVDPWQGLLVEMITTFQLVLIVFATLDPSRDDVRGSGAVAIGFSVATGLLFSIPYTGGNLNPARSFGPALVTWTWQDHWIYWVGPIGAGMLAGNLYPFIFANDASRTKIINKFKVSCVNGNRRKKFSLTRGENNHNHTSSSETGEETKDAAV